MAVRSVRGDVLLSRFFPLCPGVFEFPRRVSSADAYPNYPFSLHFYIPSTTPSQRHAQMHVGPMLVHRFTKSGRDPYDGQASGIPTELQ